MNSLGRQKTKVAMNMSVRNIERILNRVNCTRYIPADENLNEPSSNIMYKVPFLNALENGLLVCEIHLLRTYISSLPEMHRHVFKEDLDELADTQLDVGQRFNIAQRMMRTIYVT